MLDRQTLKSALAPKPDCLSPQQLERLASGDLPSHPHLAQCARCQTELDMLKSFQSEAKLPDEGAAVAWISSQLDRRLDRIKNPAQRVPAESWWTRAFAYGRMRILVPATAAIAIALVVLLLRPTKQPELQAHLRTGPEVLRSEEVQIVAPVGELDKAPQKLEWKQVPGVANYNIEIMEVDESPIFSRQTNDTLLTLPASVLARIRPGKTMLWRVAALDSQGKVIATSQLQRFVITRSKN